MFQSPLRWLWLGVTALAIAGIFAVILVAARTPQLAIFGDLFSVALVVHVDLSVLVWFLCIGCYGWSRLAAAHGPNIPYWQSGGFWCATAATALIALSPIDTHWEVAKSNYIPVLNNVMFLGGLGLLAASLLVMLLPLVPQLFTSWKNKSNEETLFLGSAFATLLALVAFFLSARAMPLERHPDLSEHFNTLFWAGGHILQFAFSLLMMAGWLVLTETISGSSLKRRWVMLSTFMVMIPAAMSLGGFIKHPFDSSDFSYYQTRLMIEFGGVGAALLAGMVLARLFKTRATRTTRAYYSSLIASLVLFLAGGLLGVMITGQNVTIPAHYHGAIVGVTLALMGYAYVLLPRYGYPSVATTRLAFWQPILYGIGQLMHIGGLAYSGGYGVLRKTPAGETPNLAPDVKAALGFMGLGGLLAIIGGLIFVVVMLRALRQRRVAAR